MSFSQCMGSSFRQTVAQILGDERMSESTMLASHTQATVSRVRACGGDYRIAAQDQDTTVYTDSGQRAMVGLGTVQVRGVRQPNVLLMSETGQPLAPNNRPWRASPWWSPPKSPV